MVKYVFFLFLSCKLVAQYPILTDSVKQSGIYLNFEEFKQNNPSVKLSYPIIQKQVKYGGLGSSYSKTVYAIDIPKKEGRDIGEVFGFCDGKDFYLIASEYTDIYFPNKIHNFNFYKVEYIGKLCFYDAVQNSGPNTGTVATLGTVVIDMNTGEINLLSKSYLKELLIEKPELLEKFKKQENKYKHLKEYLKEYLKE
jgi:hypothetical protein